jgi:hypothetical protein
MKLGFEGAAEVEAEWWRRRTYFPRSSASPFFFLVKHGLPFSVIFVSLCFVYSCGNVKVVYI